MRNRRLIIILIVLVTVGVVGISVFALSREEPQQTVSCEQEVVLTTKQITVNGKAFTAEIAQTPLEQQQGLSGRNCLGDDQAMLFTYDQPAEQCFWMKGMRFPLDMVWLDDRQRIVTMKQNVTPDTYPNSFCPDEPAQYVLEVVAGTAQIYGWKIGDQAEF